MYQASYEGQVAKVQSKQIVVYDYNKCALDNHKLIEINGNTILVVSNL